MFEKCKNLSTIRVSIATLLFDSTLLTYVGLCVCMVIGYVFYYDDFCCRLSCYKGKIVVQEIPLISDAVGFYEPGITIAKVITAVTFLPRCVFALAYKAFYSGVLHESRYVWLSELIASLQILSAICINIGIWIPSNVSFEIHTEAFIVVIISMCIEIILGAWIIPRLANEKTTLSYTWLETLQMKRIISFMFFTQPLILAYTYAQHIKYCAQYMLTIFAVFEFFTVSLIVFWLYLGVYDLEDYCLAWPFKIIKLAESHHV